MLGVWHYELTEYSTKFMKQTKRYRRKKINLNMKHKESKMHHSGNVFGPQSVNLFYYNILNTKLFVNAAA